MTAPPTSTGSKTDHLDTLRKRLWAAVAERDESAAVATVMDALDGGADPTAVLIDVIAEVQQRVGAEWAANRISVAQEHAATAINDRAIAALAGHPASRAEPNRGTVVVACIDGEWHAMPARLVAQVLTLRGWRVDYLGAQTPTPHLIAHIHQTGPDVVALSSSIATRLPAAHATISACRATGVPVLAGGAAFGPDGRYARVLGADAWAPDARAVAELLDAGVPHRSFGSPREPVDDIPHLADGEYTKVTRAATTLVRDTLTGLEQRFPAMRNYTEQQRHHTAEDVAHIVDFLAAALYVDDDELFSTFITWTGDILTARRVPAHSLHPALELLAEKLAGLARATRLITAARRALEEHLSHVAPAPGD